MKGLSRRMFMKASPAAVVAGAAAANGIAQAVIQEKAWGGLAGGGMSTPGTSYGLQGLVNQVPVEFDPIEHVQHMLKYMRTERAEIYERHNEHAGRRNIQAEATRIDGMKSLAPHVRINMIERAQRENSLKDSLSYVDKQVKQLKKEYPVAGYLVDQFMGESK